MKFHIGFFIFLTEKKIKKVANMPNKNYLRGVRFERQILEELSNKKYITMRTAGSHGVADVIAIGENHTRLIQAKTTLDFSSLSGYKKDIEKFIGKFPENVLTELWIKSDRKPVIKILIL